MSLQHKNRFGIHMHKSHFGPTSTGIKNLRLAYRKFGRKYRNALIARAKHGKDELLTREMAEQLFKIAGSEKRAIEFSKLSHGEIMHLSYDLIDVIKRGGRSVYALRRPKVNKLLSKLNYRDVRHLFSEFYANEIEFMTQFSPRTIHNLLSCLSVPEMLFILKKTPNQAIEALGRMDLKSIKSTVKKIKGHYPQDFRAIDTASGHSNPVRVNWLVNKSLYNK